MKRRRFSVEQITAVLKQRRDGRLVTDLTLDKVMLQDIPKEILKPVKHALHTSDPEPDSNRRRRSRQEAATN